MNSSRPPLEARSERRTSGRKRRYLLFGITLATDFELATRLPESAAEPDLTFSCGPSPPFAADRLLLPPNEDGSGASLAHLAQTRSHDVLRFPGFADFYIASDHIFCHHVDSAQSEMIEIQLLGSVLAFWLERRSVPALHASAVVVAGKAIAFLAGNRGGKTALAAALMRAGCAFLTDDVLPVEDRDGTFVGHPGLPQMRMWPDAAKHFLGHYEDLEIVHPDHAKRWVPVGFGGLGSPCGDARLLSCLYLPERRRSEAARRGLEIVPVSRRDAMIELIRHSFVAQIAGAAEWQARRFDFFARFVQRVPLRRLRYPNGFDRLSSVGAGILEDLTTARSGVVSSTT